MATCIDLLETFGTAYRVTFDPAYDSRHVPRRCLDRWMMQLPCRGRGVCIYPHGGNRLGVEVDARPSLVKRLAALPGLQRWQDGDRATTFLFDLARFEAVAAVVRPRKRRRLREGQRRACSERLARARSPAPT